MREILKAQGKKRLGARHLDLDEVSERDRCLHRLGEGWQPRLSSGVRS
jgi:hypothetical protein